MWNRAVDHFCMPHYMCCLGYFAGIDFQFLLYATRVHCGGFDVVYNFFAVCLGEKFDVFGNEDDLAKNPKILKCWTSTIKGLNPKNT